jgi:hypothetical protein
MKAGDTFRCPDRSVDTHLWVVISDPSQNSSQVLIVSLTTYGPKKEATCILKAGVHPFIKHDTCVAYGLANAPSIAQLEKARVDGHLTPDVPVSAAVLQRIREGAALSPRLKIDFYDLLDAQGLV